MTRSIRRLTVSAPANASISDHIPPGAFGSATLDNRESSVSEYIAPHRYQR